jgi:hypothetical protein
MVPELNEGLTLEVQALERVTQRGHYCDYYH